MRATAKMQINLSRNPTAPVGACLASKGGAFDNPRLPYNNFKELP